MLATVSRQKTDLMPLIREKVLETLEIEIMDLQDYTDMYIPDDYHRYHIYRSGKNIGAISTHGATLYTRIIPNTGYANLYQAATCWVNPWLLKEIELRAEREVIEQYNSSPDYF